MDLGESLDQRRCLSDDLHDTLGPTLAGIRLRLETVADRLAHEPELRHLVAGAAAETVRAIEELRRIVDDLDPADLRWGLPGALRRLAERLSATGIAMSVEMPTRVPPLSRTVERAAYRIAAEGLSNVVRHASARLVRIRLACNDDRLVLEITDDGLGLPATWATRTSSGRGLASMAERAWQLGGRCEVVPLPEARSGTLVRAELPGVLA